MRPGLIFKGDAASGIRRLFAGPLLPGVARAPGARSPRPSTSRLVFQAVHAHDAGEAYRLAVVGDARGPFNLAAEPELDGAELGAVLGARPVPLPAPLLGGAARSASGCGFSRPSPAGWTWRSACR